MVADLGLIDTKHQCVENCRRQIIIVNLIALVRRLDLWTIIIEEEEESIGGSWNALIKE
jgi:hypothetical protein